MIDTFEALAIVDGDYSRDAICESLAFASIDEALAELRADRMIVIVDDEDPENEGDVMVAAEMVNADALNFMAKHARGLICLAITGERADALELGQMVSRNTSWGGTVFTVSIDALGRGVTTGISARDRAQTILAAIDSDTRPEDRARPGHIFPIRARKDGVLERRGQTEAARVHARRELELMGGLRREERRLILIMLAVMAGWITSPWHHIPNAFVALAGVSMILIFRVCSWNDLLSEGKAWDALIWFAPIIMMAGELNKRGVVRTLSQSLFEYTKARRLAPLTVDTINRSALIVKPAQPFLDWLHQVDPTSGRLALEDLQREPTIYLVVSLRRCSGTRRTVTSARTLTDLLPSTHAMLAALEGAAACRREALEEMVSEAMIDRLERHLLSVCVSRFRSTLASANIQVESAIDLHGPERHYPRSRRGGTCSHAPCSIPVFPLDPISKLAVDVIPMHSKCSRTSPWCWQMCPGRFLNR